MIKTVDSAVPVTCWSCSAGCPPAALFCPHCDSIQPVRGSGYFAIFGLEPRLQLDIAALEREFYRLSRLLHPDRYVHVTEAEKEFSLAGSALLNDAYRTLHDPLRRTEYLLGLLHAEPESPSSDAEHRNPSSAPADLLEEVFELNQQLESLRHARRASEKDPGLEANLSQARDRYQTLVDNVDEELRAQWKAWDEGDGASRLAAERQMKSLLGRRRFLDNLVREVRQTLGA